MSQAVCRGCKVRDSVFKIVQVGTVGTTWNPSDIGTKLLARDRHFMILFMLGFVCDGERVGEEQFLKQKQMEFSRRSMKMISNAVVSQFQFGKAHSPSVKLECSWGLGSGHG